MMLSPEKVLIIEDEPASREAMADYISRKGIPVMVAADGQEGIEFLDADVAVVVTDLKMPRMDGMAVLREVRARQPQTGVILVTAFGDIASAVDAMRQGASDYLTKPVNPDELYLRIRRIYDSRSLQHENADLRRQLEEKYGFEEIIGISRPMIAIFERIKAVAPTDSTVLITGPSGSGKELVAQALHRHSRRKDKLFVALSGAAIPDNLVESELFGHARGAFTGAGDSAIGKFEAADGGTLFIDEVAELNLAVQAKLLRVLETRTFSPLGSTRSRKTDVRLIFATNRNLHEAVQSKRFRDDLYYRIKVVTIEMPSLMERRDDIPILAQHFVEAFACRHGKGHATLTSQAVECLRKYHWPGNVRELRNCLESVVVLLQKETIAPEDLPAEIREARVHRAPLTTVPAGVPIEDLEREAIEKTLRKVNGSRAKAAKLLGLSVRTLQRKIAAYELDG